MKQGNAFADNALFLACSVLPDMHTVPRIHPMKVSTILTFSQGVENRQA